VEEAQVIRDALHAMLVVCPFCVQELKPSTVMPKQAAVDVPRVVLSTGGPTVQRDLPFFDAEGRFHVHDEQTYTVVFQCSRNHKFAGKEIKTVCGVCAADKEAGKPETPTP
jgi:hypothetical protein